MREKNGKLKESQTIKLSHSSSHFGSVLRWPKFDVQLPLENIREEIDRVVFGSVVFGHRIVLLNLLERNIACVGLSKGK